MDEGVLPTASPLAAVNCKVSTVLPFTVSLSVRRRGWHSCQPDRLDRLDAPAQIHVADAVLTTASPLAAANHKCRPPSMPSTSVASLEPPGVRRASMVTGVSQAASREAPKRRDPAVVAAEP